jgi:hypothetical protein
VNSKLLLHLSVKVSLNWRVYPLPLSIGGNLNVALSEFSTLG